jgi:hypothetical protein
MQALYSNIAFYVIQILNILPYLTQSSYGIIIITILVNKLISRLEENTLDFIHPHLFYAFSFKANCQFTLHLNLSSIIFCFTHSGFLHTWTLNCGF